MMADFDPNDKDSWYFGAMSRDATNEMLNERVETGVFLVRDSSSIKGDFVLCVREGAKVSHYIINKCIADGAPRYRIGDQDFADIPSLLTFYKRHYLDTTPLVRPIDRLEFKVIAKFDFPGRDPDDLPFTKDEVLTVVRKDEENWWTAKNSTGKQGQIPVPYIQLYEENDFSPPSYNSHLSNNTDSTPSQTRAKNLPASARVITQRNPNAYDKTALKLEVGEIITVTSCPLTGQWEGVRENGQKGHFPFNFVEFVDQ